ncbi:anti-sigma factor [Streptomyces sp. NPDC093111]|uniref:anti-sigma factor n=1 Tax=Streptomyces sp. NPDC093111 TaxID=3154978 RepID=UPI0034364458
MKHDATDTHTLAAPYTLDALEPGERGAFEDHLRTCAACRQEVAEFDATAARLAAAVALAPPATAKARTMAAIEGVRQLPPRVPTQASAPAFGSALRRKAPALALAAAVAAALVGGATVWQVRHTQDLERQARQAQQRLDAVSAVLAAPDARTTHARAANGALATVVTSDRQNKAVFTAVNLPAPGTGRTYQLWLDHDGTMLPAGLIDHDGTVILAGDSADASAVGLTLEPAGGSPQPTTTPLLLMTLPT